MAYDHFSVAGNEVTPFAIPGDSGSLVLNQKGEVLGVVMEMTQLEAHKDIYVTKGFSRMKYHQKSVDIVKLRCTV